MPGPPGTVPTPGAGNNQDLNLLALVEVPVEHTKSAATKHSLQLGAAATGGADGAHHITSDLRRAGSAGQGREPRPAAGSDVIRYGQSQLGGAPFGTLAAGRRYSYVMLARLLALRAPRCDILQRTLG